MAGVSSESAFASCMTSGSEPKFVLCRMDVPCILGCHCAGEMPGTVSEIQYAFNQCIFYPVLGRKHIYREGDAMLINFPGEFSGHFQYPESW